MLVFYPQRHPNLGIHLEKTMANSLKDGRVLVPYSCHCCLRDQTTGSFICIDKAVTLDIWREAEYWKYRIIWYISPLLVLHVGIARFALSSNLVQKIRI